MNRENLQKLANYLKNFEGKLSPEVALEREVYGDYVLIHLKLNEEIKSTSPNIKFGHLAVKFPVKDFEILDII